jgi:cell division protein FtsA
MGRERHNIITAIDVGSAKTCALVAQLTDNGLRYRGHGVAESRGSRKGVIIDLEKAIASVQRAVDDAEQSSGVAVEEAIVGVAGAHVRGIQSQGGILLGARAKEVGQDELRAAVDRARAISLPPDREILHLLPREYILDEQPGIRDPEGMMGTRLEVKVHVITGSGSAAQNVVTTLNRAGIQVNATVFEPLAAADSLLRADERELGVCLIDVGAGSTDIVVFQDGSVIHSAVIPIGGDHFTSDVAVGLRTPLIEAEKIKRMFGCCVVVRIPLANEIEVPPVGDGPSSLIPQRMLGEILEPRARELFELVRQNLRNAGVLEFCAGAVLSGGGARMPSMLEVAEDALRRPARLGYPVPLPGMPAALGDPEYACVLGLLYYGYRARMARRGEEQTVKSKLRALLGAAFSNQPSVSN